MSDNNFGNGTPPSSGPPPVPTPPQWTGVQPPLAQPQTWTGAQPPYGSQPPYSPQPGTTPYNPQPGNTPYGGPQPAPPYPYGAPGTAYPYANPAPGVGGAYAPGYWAQPVPPQPHKSKAWIWIVVAAVVVLAIVAGVTYMVTRPSPSPIGTSSASSTSSAPGPSAASTSQAGAKMGINSALVGDCFDTSTMAADDYLYIRPLDCTTAHDAEIVFVDTVNSVTYPGSDWKDFVTDLCFPAFADYVGDSYYESDLGLDYVYPLEYDWTMGDHTLICYAYADTPVTTPLQGSGR